MFPARDLVYRLVVTDNGDLGLGRLTATDSSFEVRSIASLMEPNGEYDVAVHHSILLY